MIQINCIILSSIAFILPNVAATCCHDGGNKSETILTDTLSLQTIHKIPDDIDGGMCQLYLSDHDKNTNNPFCITDMGEILYIHVNGELNKLRQDSLFSDSCIQYRNDKYLMKVNFQKQEEQDDERYDIKGYCKIYSTDSLHVYKHSFIGVCNW